MKNKTQIFLVHGGETFKNQKDYLNYLKNRAVSIEKRPRWALEYLDKELGKKFEIIRPRMPLPENAKYEEWKIVFKKYIPFLKNKFILIGNSLGGIFLMKYLSENRLPKKALSVYAVCAPFDGEGSDEDLVGGFNLKSNLSLIYKNTKNLYLLFSKDDTSVPVTNAEKYRRKLKDAYIAIYEGKNGHFNVPKFPELIKLVRNDVKRI